MMAGRRSPVADIVGKGWMRENMEARVSWRKGGEIDG